MDHSKDPLTKTEIHQLRALALRALNHHPTSTRTPEQNVGYLTQILQTVFGIEPEAINDEISLTDYYTYLEGLPKHLLYQRFKRVIDLARTYGMFAYVDEGAFKYVKRCLDELIRRGAVPIENLPTFPLYHDAVLYTQTLRALEDSK